MAGWKVGCLILVLAVVLWACTPETASSPEQAVYRELSQNPEIISSSIQVQPAIPWRNQYFVLAAYNLTQNESNPLGYEECTAIFEIVRTNAGWEIHRPSLSCSDSVSNGWSTLIGTHHLCSNPNQQFSYTSGETPLDEARWIEITWKDGTLQHVPIYQNIFFALRDDAHEPGIYTLLDENEKVVSERTP